MNVNIYLFNVKTSPPWAHKVFLVFFQSVLLGITHHRTENKFATCGEVCQLWDETRNEPIRIFEWNVDSLHNIAFNQIETHVLGILIIFNI